MTSTSVYMQLDLHEQVEYIFLCPTIISLLVSVHFQVASFDYSKKICLLLIREYVVGLPHKTTILFYCTIFYFHFWVFHARVGKSLLMRSAQAIVSYQNKWLRCSRKNTNTFIKLFYEVMRQSTSPNMASMALSAIEDKFDAITSYPLGSYK